MKKAILAVSFGTSHIDTLEKTIDVIEKQMQDTFPDYVVYRAFTSQMIINKLKKTKNLYVDNVEEALARMAADQIEEVLVQPTHIINGLENDRMLSALGQFSGHFQTVQVGTPLLTTPKDYQEAILATIRNAFLAEDELLVFMGHGTCHHANSAYPMLEYTAHAAGYPQVFVGTVEGFPGLADVMRQLPVTGKKKIVLMPFMIVAGDHAKNDMAGDGESWKTELEAAGYEVRTILKGLGELEGIRDILIQHMKTAETLITGY